LLAFGCSDEGDDEGAATTTTAPAEETTTTISEETAVIDAYRASWAAFVTASGNPVDPDHPALAAAMTGDALEGARQAIGALAEQGHYYAGPPPDLVPQVVELDTDRAVVEDCVIDTASEFAADGSTVNQGTDVPIAYRAVMVKEDGAWKNAELEQLETCTR
jgi:hypothetical protein